MKRSATRCPEHGQYCVQITVTDEDEVRVEHHPVPVRTQGVPPAVRGVAWTDQTEASTAALESAIEKAEASIATTAERIEQIEKAAIERIEIAKRETDDRLRRVERDARDRLEQYEREADALTEWLQKAPEKLWDAIAKGEWLRPYLSRLVEDIDEALQRAYKFRQSVSEELGTINDAWLEEQLRKMRETVRELRAESA